MIYLARFLLLPICLVYSSIIFTIGDSVDRYILEDWCVLKGDPPGCTGSRCILWAAADVGIKPPPHMAPSDLLCTMPKDTIGFGHHYGSAAQGPYYHDLTTANDPLVNSDVRIPRLLEVFFARVGTPNLIIYHSAIWDLHRIYELHGTFGSTDHGDLSVPHTSVWNSTLLTFESNLNNRIDAIISTVNQILCAGKDGGRDVTLSRNCSVDIALRTAVWFSTGGPLLHAMNGIIRHIARERELSLFDFDKDVWGTVNWDVSQEKMKLFRDFIHPKPYYTSLAGEKLLGNRYTRYLQFRGQSASHWPQVWLGDGPRPARVMEVKLIREQEPRSDVDKDKDEEGGDPRNGRNPDSGYGHESFGVTPAAPAGVGENSASGVNEGALFYLEEKNDEDISGNDQFKAISRGTVIAMQETQQPQQQLGNNHYVRYGPFNRKFRTVLRLSPGDVYSVPKGLCDSIPLRGSAPVALLDEIDRLNGTAPKFVINSTAGVIYTVDGSTRRRVPSLKALEGIGLNASQIYSGVDHFWIEPLAPVEEPPVPDMFYDNTLVRYFKSKEIWAIVDMKKHSVANMQVLFNHGWDLDQVIVLDRLSDLDAIPTGDGMEYRKERRLRRRRQ